MVAAAGRGGNPGNLGFSPRRRRATLEAMSGSERDRNRCRERLDVLSAAGLEPDDAKRAAIAELRRAVGFERWCWPTTDPDTAVSTAGIAEFDLWPTLPRLIALEEHGDVTSKPRLALSGRTSVTLSGATGGDLARSRRWAECLAPYGVGDELMTVCRDRHGCWGSVELMRDDDEPPFDDEDVRFLQEVAPMLARLLRSGFARSSASARDAAALPPPATLIVDERLRATSWTATAHAWLAELGAGAGAMLPPAVYEIGTRVLTPPAEATSLSPSVRLRTRTGSWAVIGGAALEGEERGRVALTFRAATTDEVFDLLAKSYDLTRRERQLVALVLDGLATKQLAVALSISPHTVQDHLKAVYLKTGARSRPELVSQLSGRTAF
jgi:DNA-binding CsgD family transcriptional regulator